MNYVRLSGSTPYLYAVAVLVGAAVTTIAVGLVLLILIDAKLPPHP